jgi:dynein heavy chain 2, cytosolic
MTHFVCRSLNVSSLAPPPLNVRHLYEKESSALEPLLFVITPGSDPSQELKEFAKTAVGEDNYEEVAMGQGQAEIALRLLRDCAKTGRWLCLKNLHLVTSWLPVLEKEIFSLHEPAPTFRLFLTTEAHPKFPDSLLEHCLKVTYEPPPGIKKNLQRTFDAWGPQYFEGGSAVRAQLLFVLAWLYAVLQERRQYIPQVRFIPSTCTCLSLVLF